MASRVIKISVEGNIATGKSTFIEFLKTVNPAAWHVVPEPVSEWTKIPDSDKVLKSPQEGQNVKNSPLKSPIRSPMKNRSACSTPIRSGGNALKSPIRVRDNEPTVGVPATTSQAVKRNVCGGEKISGGKSILGGATPACEEDDDNENSAINCPSAANLLELFYKDTSRWAYTFQSYAILSRMRLQKRPPPKSIRNAKNPVMFYERSLYTDRYIFARNCWETELMTDTEWNIYSDWSDYLLDTQGDVHIHGVIYLRAEPQVSHMRLNKRSRSEEKGLTLEYLQQLHNKHEAWLHDKNVEKHDSLYDVPILELDCNKDFESDEVNRNRLFEKVKVFIRDCHADNIKRRVALLEADKENCDVQLGGKKQRLSFEPESTSSNQSTLNEKMERLPFEQPKKIENSVFGPGGDSIAVSDENS